MSVKKIFFKQGGFSFISTLFKRHILFYSFLQFLILPKNKTGLELLRESINLKSYLKLKNKLKIKNIKKDESKINNEKEKIIWFCWLQGVDEAPLLVKRCYESIQKFCFDYKINFIDSKNFLQYTNIPDYIISKWNKGIISNTHFSDILRINLLAEQGGTWIDSTVLLTAKIPQDIENSSLFMFRTYKPGSNGKAVNLSSWFISANRENKILKLTQEFLFYYWKKQNYLCDYFLLHNFIQIAFEIYPEEETLIPKYTNETPHFMLFELSKEFNRQKWTSFCNQSFCHKLTYKLTDKEESKSGTFYKFILEKKS
jgi:hypothetical protein